MLSLSRCSNSCVWLVVHLFVFVVLLITLGLATKQRPEQRPADWATFKRVYGKKYGSSAEETRRFVLHGGQSYILHMQVSVRWITGLFLYDLFSN